MSKTKVDRRIKAIVIGDSGSGKSTIVGRYADNEYEGNYIPTICLDFKLKYIEHAGKRIRLDIYDTAGQERFRSVAKTYYKQADICILVCDVSEYESFKNLNYWMSEFRRHGDAIANDKTVCLIVGNKTDLPRMVETRELAIMAYEHECKFVEVSAKDNIGIESLFESLIDDVIRSDSNEVHSSAALTLDIESKPNILSDKSKSKSCC